MKKILLTLIVSFCIYSVNSQLVITSTNNYQQLVDSFILTGVTASNVVYTGSPDAVGSFSNGVTTNIGMPDGILLTTGIIDSIPSISSPPANFLNYFNSTPGDLLLDALIPGYITYDASVLEFDLIPVGSILEFQYVFASEEYPEYVGSSFNDVFGFFISGQDPLGGNYADQNIAIIPGTSMVVSINNVNATTNPTYFVDNLAASSGTIAYDGFTTVLTVQISVVPGQTYHLKMGVADAGDGIFDSAIFLKAQSMKSYNPAGIAEVDKKLFNIPNPLNRGDEFNLNLNKSGNLSIQIMDATGKEISSLCREIASPGDYTFNANEIFGNSSNGLYFMSITFNGKRQSVKLYFD